jgi:hypothetical protein
MDGVRLLRIEMVDDEPTCGRALPPTAGLAAVANTMRNYRDLPMAAHDENTLADQQSLRVFESLVREEEALLGSLQAIASEHREMLGHSAE